VRLYRIETHDTLVFATQLVVTDGVELRGRGAARGERTHMLVVADSMHAPPRAQLLDSDSIAAAAVQQRADKVRVRAACRRSSECAQHASLEHTPRGAQRSPPPPQRRTRANVDTRYQRGRRRRRCVSSPSLTATATATAAAAAATKYTGGGGSASLGVRACISLLSLTAQKVTRRSNVNARWTCVGERADAAERFKSRVVAVGRGVVVVTGGGGGGGGVERRERRREQSGIKGATAVEVGGESRKEDVAVARMVRVARLRRRRRRRQRWRRRRRQNDVGRRRAARTLPHEVFEKHGAQKWHPQLLPLAVREATQMADRRARRCGERGFELLYIYFVGVCASVVARRQVARQDIQALVNAVGVGECEVSEPRRVVYHRRTRTNGVV
jgi:hypothetical protein